MANTVQKFLLNDLNIRGVFVQLDSAWQEVLARRSYPATVGALLGESSVAALLMSSHIKFNGKLTLQLQSDGDLNLLVVQSDNRHNFRSLARYKGLLGGNLTNIAENGVVIISIEANEGEQPYQGVVAVDSDSLSENLETYFTQSEQLPTILVVRANNYNAGGVLLQAMPDCQASEDDWKRLRMVSETLNVDELKDIDSQTMIQRIFAEDDIVVYPEKTAAFACTCSDERTLGMLSSLSDKELNELIDDGEDVVIDCDFCGKHYCHDIPTLSAMLAHRRHPN